MKPQIHFPLILQRVYNAPLALTPQKAQMVSLAIAERLGVAQPGRLVAFDEDDRAVTLGGNRHVERRGYELIDNIAVIPITGTLVQKLGQARPWCGMLGYDSIRLNFATALEDEEVEGILFDVDSPGGEVAGLFDLVDMIADERRSKPLWASVDECACSAAYAIASAADYITIPRTGEAGSIGVISMHVDWSRFLDKEGIAVTFIQYGARKADGAPEKPLSDEAMQALQEKVDQVGDLFVNTVAKNRDLDADDVAGQEAGVFMGEDAVAAGLADEVMPIDEAFAAFRSEITS